MEDNLMVSKGDIALRNISVFILLGDVMYSLFPFPQMVWRLALVLVCCFVLVKKNRPLTKLEKWMLVLCVLNFIYFFIALLSGRRISMTQMGNLLCAMLPLSLFTYLSQKNVFNEKCLSVVTAMLFVAAVVYYINYQRHRFMIKDVEDTTINASTVFLMLLPLLFYEKKKLLFFGELFVALFFIVSAVKRGNILAAAIPTLLLAANKYNESKKSIIGVLLVVAFIVASAIFLKNYIMSDEYFLLRLEDTMEGNSSNRDSIYAAAWGAWYNSDNIFQLLFGHGWRAVTRIVGTPAHSDWLEILVDNGLLGVVVYFFVFFCFWKIIRKTDDKLDKMVLFSAFAIWGAKSIYSMAYVENLMSLLMLPIGIAIGDAEKTKIANEG